MSLSAEERKKELAELEEETKNLKEWPPIDENSVLDI
jgi:hypothetical protein